MIKTRVLLGLLAGFTVGTLLGAMFSSRGTDKDEKGKKGRGKDVAELEEEEVITF